MKNRIEWIDAAKGLGIFLVVLGHALPPVGLLTTTIWAFHMPLFFFLSGLNAKPWDQSNAYAFVRAIRNLIAPYIFFSIVGISLWSAANGKFLSFDTWIEQLRQATYGVAGKEGLMRYDAPLWFFTCLVSVRLIFATLTGLIRSVSLQLIAVGILALFAHIYIYKDFKSLLWNFDVAFSALIFFTAGYFLPKINQIRMHAFFRHSSLKNITAIFILGLAVFYNGRVDMNAREFGLAALFYLGAFSGIAITATVSRRFASASILHTLGNASIVIFPVHMLFSLYPHRIVPTLLWYLFRITGSDIAAAVIVTVTEIGLCLPIYYTICRWAPLLIGKSHNTATRPHNDDLVGAKA